MPGRLELYQKYKARALWQEYLLAIQSVIEGKPENYYWREFNRNIQKMIDNTLAGLEPLLEQLGLE